LAGVEDIIVQGQFSSKRCLELHPFFNVLNLVPMVGVKLL
jgi:hypothetical protein